LDPAPLLEAAGPLVAGDRSGIFRLPLAA